jgi:acetyl-CoA decarbonylase/synthase complex subunit gamma
MAVELFDLRGGSTRGGGVQNPAADIPAVPTRWTRRDGLGQLKCRLSNAFRMNYAVPPGIYAVGGPDSGSAVLATANYKLSFDLLRRELEGLRAWIVVLDTRGINVWCAAGKGTFGTEELIRRIRCTGLPEIVDHRRIILPQLGAPGVQAHIVKEQTGFTVEYGPVYARDLPAYLQAGHRATPAMRRVRFGFKERLELTPMEVAPALKGFGIFLAAAFLLFGLEPEGILFRSILDAGLPAAILGGAALLSGTFLTPLLLPWIPFRSFALKGLTVGAVITAGLVFLLPAGALSSAYLRGFSLAFFPAACSYLALQFTGSTTFTGISGVRKELKIGLPLYFLAAGVSSGFFIFFKLQQWGVVS